MNNKSLYYCKVCKSKGFEPSITGEGCTFCDGTEGGNPPDTTKEAERWWYFTFGYGQAPGIGYYTKRWGTMSSARQQMFDDYGNKWSFQYPTKLAAGVDEWNLKEV